MQNTASISFVSYRRTLRLLFVIVVSNPIGVHAHHIWRLLPNSVHRIEHQTNNSVGASPTLTHIAEGGEVHRHETLRYIRHGVNQCNSTFRHASRESFRDVLQDLIAQERRLTPTHDIMYHGTAALDAMLLRRHLWRPESDRLLLMRNPNETVAIEDASLASYVEREAQRMGMMRPAYDGRGIAYSHVDWHRSFAALLVAANVSALGNNRNSGESSYRFLLDHEPQTREERIISMLSTMGVLSSAAFGLWMIDWSPLLVMPFVAGCASRWTPLYRNRQSRYENRLEDTLRAFGCPKEVRSNHLPQLEHAARALSPALLQIAVPRTLRNAWYFSYPFGYPMVGAEELSDDQMHARWQDDETQVRVRADVLDDPAHDVRMEVYVAGEHDAISQSLSRVQEIAEQIRNETV